MITKNPRGYIRFPSEYELYAFLEKEFLPKIGTNFSPSPNPKTRWSGFPLAPRRFIDYKGENKDGKTILVEVKNWFVSNDGMMQLMGYLDHATERYGEQNFDFYLITGGIEDYRRGILEKLGFKIQLTRDL